MKKEEFCQILGDISEKHIADARADRKTKKPALLKWGAIAACLCLVLVGACLFNALNHTDFYSMVNGSTVHTTLTLTNIDIGGWSACYVKHNIDSARLERYVGEQYVSADSNEWYYPKEANNLKYLIKRDSDGTLSLWSFASFYMNDGDVYTYGDILRIIYSVESADDIVSITTSPSKANNTDTGIAIQREVGTKYYTDRDDIQVFFDIACDVICYGMDSKSKADDNRFTYSFSTESSDKLTSGETTYGTRHISIEFEDGTILDTWQYSALSGSFFEYYGIFTEPLAEEAVYRLNDIFDIH